MEISLNGQAHKYTNFLFGYQERYFKLHNGAIYYYLSKDVEKEGCRKFRTLTNFSLQYDDDPCRMDIVFPDEKWSLRFFTRDELILWRDALQALLIEKDASQEQVRLFSSSTNSSASPSMLFASECEPNTSNASFSSKVCKSKANEIDINTLKQLRHDIPTRLSSVMSALDSITDLMTKNELRLNSSAGNETIAELGSALSNCRQLKQDVEFLRRSLKLISLKLENEAKAKVNNVENTDDEGNDEWADAIDTNDNTFIRDGENSFCSLDVTTKSLGENYTQVTSFHSAVEELDDNVFYSPAKKTPSNLTLRHCDTMCNKANIKKNDSSLSLNFDKLFPPHLIAKNPLFLEIQTIAWEQLRHALAPLENGGWDLFVKDGEMRMYRMDHEDEGIVCDPLKAVHSVKGVCAREFIDTFFDPDLKTEWDDTLVRLKNIEQLAENTFVLHQLHKRIWPSAQREALFWSQRIDVSAHRDPDAIDAFLVCNHETEREDVPLTDSSCVRVKLTIAMLCQTVLMNPNKAEDLSRDDVRCKITYVAQVHPGGWVPTSALRQVYKREYPKFLRRFTDYVVKRVKSQPLNL